jgi:DNA primase
MQRERKLQAIRQTLGHELITKGDEVVFLCIKCQHRKPKLSVNLATDRFHCWVCGFSGKVLVPLFPRGSKERQEYIEEIREKTEPEKQPERRYETPTLPAEFQSLSKPGKGPYYNAAMGYLAARGIDRGDILRWKLGYCEDGEHRNRIIIPSFDEYGHLNFCVGRTIYNDPKKYKHGFYCKDIIWNDYLIDWEKPVVVTEGPFDAFKARENVVALQGSILNSGSKLFSKIVLSGVDVFFAMDQDAFDKQLTIIKNLVSYGVTCRYVGLGGKADVGEMTKEEFRRAKERSVVIRSDVDLLKLRITAWA